MASPNTSVNVPVNVPVNVIDKLWNFCNVLRDDGVSYGDYVEQLTYLLFLKMADETARLPKALRPQNGADIPKDLDWSSLSGKSGEDLEKQYLKILRDLGKKDGMLGVIFKKAQNRIQDPAKLERLVSYINKEKWVSLDADVKSEIYEGLLEKNAQDVKSGAGQYFTPRPLIKAIVEVMKPKPDISICDPAVGTGGFLIRAYQYILEHSNPTRDQHRFLVNEAFRGWEIVDNTARLCAMNLYLRGIGGNKNCPIILEDSLKNDPGIRFDMVLTNPPFGKKSSITIVGEDGRKAKEQSLSYERGDFITTSNKQLNFLQHVSTLLKTTGRAAIVLPDNVLFEGGVGEQVRDRLMKRCNVHTLLRLPTGIFYAQGVKANVLFFDARPASADPQTKKLWIYDLRTNRHFTLKANPLSYEDLQDFIKCYHPEDIHKREETERFKAYDYEDLIKRDKVNLDIFWMKDDSLEDTENLPEPEIIAFDIVENLRSALKQYEGVYEGVNGAD